jgi:hypothetical protein
MNKNYSIKEILEATKQLNKIDIRINSQTQNVDSLKFSKIGTFNNIKTSPLKVTNIINNSNIKPLILNNILSDKDVLILNRLV